MKSMINTGPVNISRRTDLKCTATATVTFIDKGNGFFVADLPVKAETRTLTIRRK